MHNKANKLIITTKDNYTKKVNLFVQFYNVSSFKQETHRINAMVTPQVRAHVPNIEVVITPYHQ